MYLTRKVYVKPEMKLANLVSENLALLLLMEHFNIEDAINEKTVEQICKEQGINLSVFIVISNLYNGFFPDKKEIVNSDMDIPTIINFLKKNHSFYRNKYPEILSYIKELYKKQKREDISQIEVFFHTYFEEVLEHLKYEDETAFPYFLHLIGKSEQEKTEFTASEYRQHHTDIETKLSDIKNLLLKHIALKGDFPLKRKILNSLFLLENELLIHSLIEETILLPLIEEVEKNKKKWKK